MRRPGLAKFHVQLQRTAIVRATLNALEIPNVKIVAASFAEHLGLMLPINAPSNAHLGMLLNAIQERAALHGRAVLKQRVFTVARLLRMQVQTARCHVRVCLKIVALKVKDASNTPLVKRLSNQKPLPPIHINHQATTSVANQKNWPQWHAPLLALVGKTQNALATWIAMMAQDAAFATAFGVDQVGWMRRKSVLSPAVAEVLTSVLRARVATLRLAVKPTCSSVATATKLHLVINRVKAGHRTSVTRVRNASHLLKTVRWRETHRLCP